MTSQYNNVIYVPTDVNQMNYVYPYANNHYQYIKYIPTNIPLTQPVMNLPIIYGQNNTFSDFIDCEISVEDGQNLGLNSHSYSNSVLSSPNSRMSNNPINYMRSKSPQVVRNNNLGLNNYNIYYAQNNSSSNVRSNSVLNYSLESYEPIRNNSNNNSPLLNNVPKLNLNTVQFSTNNNLNQSILSTPVKRASYYFPKTLSVSTKHQKYPQTSRNVRNDKKRSVTVFQSPKVLNNNYIPLQNYQTIAVNTSPIELNNRTINTNLNNNVVLNNSIQMNNLQKYKSKLLNNNPYSKLTNKSNKSKKSNNLSQNKLNKDLNQNTLSPIMKDNSNEKFLNSNFGSNNQSLSKLFRSCSNTHLLSNCPSNSNYNISNIKESSSPNPINISEFNNDKVLAGKNPSLATIENKSKIIRHSITSVTSNNSIKNNNMSNPFIKNTNTNMN